MDFGVKEKCISTNNTYDFFLFLTVILILSLGQSNHTLLSLRLSGNKIGNEGSMHMASLLQVNDTLEELELSDCDLVNTHTHTHHEPIRSHHDQLHPAVSQATQSVTALAIALKNNTALRCIDISRPLLFSHQV